jgi:hypothetical protein
MNTFRSKNYSKKPTKKELKLTDPSEFPGLTTNETTAERMENSLNFLEVSQRVTPTKVDIPNFMKLGWTELTLDETNNSVIYKRNETTDLCEYDVFQQETQTAITNMTRRWDQYKRYYDELHGEDAYVNCYSMEFYSEDFDCEE